MNNKEKIHQRILPFFWIHYTLGSLTLAASPSPSETKYPSECNTMLSSTLQMSNGTINAFTNLATASFIFNLLNLIVSNFAIYILLRKIPPTEMQTTWSANLDVSQLEKIKISLLKLKQDGLTFNVCPIYFLHKESIPELETPINKDNVFLAPDYVYYNINNFIRWVEYSASIIKHSLCSPVAPSINIQFTTDDMARLKEHINSGYGLNQCFVNFFKDTTRPISLEKIEGNPIEVNSNTTYDEKNIIQYISNKLSNKTSFGNITDPTNRKKITSLRYNASFTVFKDQIPENAAEKENDEADHTRDWFIDISEDDIMRFM